MKSFVLSIRGVNMQAIKLVERSKSIIKYIKWSLVIVFIQMPDVVLLTCVWTDKFVSCCLCFVLQLYVRFLPLMDRILKLITEVPSKRRWSSVVSLIRRLIVWHFGTSLQLIIIFLYKNILRWYRFSLRMDVLYFAKTNWKGVYAK